jgi:hypothetical protein
MTRFKRRLQHRRRRLRKIERLQFGRRLLGRQASGFAGWCNARRRLRHGQRIRLGDGRCGPREHILTWQAEQRRQSRGCGRLARRRHDTCHCRRLRRIERLCFGGRLFGPRQRRLTWNIDRCRRALGSLHLQRGRGDAHRRRLFKI